MKFIRAFRKSTAVFGNKTFLFFLTNLVFTLLVSLLVSEILSLFVSLLASEILSLLVSLLVSAILSSKYATYFDPPDLSCVGDRLAFEVSGIYEAFMQHSRDFASQFYFDKKKIQEKPDGEVFINQSFKFGGSLDFKYTFHSAKKSKSKVEIMFDFLFEEVERLLTYPVWLPIERCQISYYYEKLVYFSKELERCIITDAIQEYQLIDKIPLSLLVSEILSSKHVASFDPPDLTHFGDRIAFEVSQIYKTFMHDSPDLASQFHFNKKKFQEFEGEVFVGFQIEASNLLEQLACITKKRLKVISIVGMAGLGKTTLATRLYNDPYVISYFYVRAWVTCSQVHNKKDLLLSILKSVIDITDEVCMMDDNTLAHVLYRALKGRRYLVVVDDIWSDDTWDDFKRSFPDDNNGSRIMLTTRLKDVALHAQSDGYPLCLRFLTEEESFNLFEKKVFMTGNSLDSLSLIGKSITRKCRGLPLAIVVIAGVLRNNFKKAWWAKVEREVSSYIVIDENQYMNTLALSYKHLPQHLRPCFLSFGAFPEDSDIPVRNLIWLWVAEGFISQDGTIKSLEDVAEDYLMDLIRRSLVVVGKKGCDGSVKTCRIHDLLRDLCLRKADETNFSPDIYRHNKHSYSCPHSLTDPSKKSQLVLCTNALTIPSNCSCYSSKVSQSFFRDVPILWDTSKLIRSLDISSIEFFVFPTGLLGLTNLRYLKLRFRSGNPPESIFHFTELQTLIMSSKTSMVVPMNMWKMISLKHLCITSGENLLCFSIVGEGPVVLENLQTMSLVSPTRPCQHILARTSNLRKLGLCGPLMTKSGDLKCPDLGQLVHLETLKLLNTIPLCKAGRLSTSIIFPGSLKNLTVSNTYLDWSEAWVFAMIPSLQVLKLKLHAFVGEHWETSLEAFPCLKLLKLHELDIVNWTAYRNHFPVLQHLKVYQCPSLTEIPEDFGNICTLEWIELSGCSDAATNSATDIQKEQELNGNDSFKVILNPGPTL